MRRAPAGASWERLSAYLDGELPLADRERLERELENDPELRAALEHLRRLSAQLTVDDADFVAARGIRASLRESWAGPARRSVPAARRRWRLPAAAAAAVGVAALAFVAVRAPVAGPPDRAVHAQAVAEQYALALDALGKDRP